MSNLLPDLDPVQAVESRRAELLEDSTKEYTKQFGRAYDLFDMMVNAIADQFPDDPTMARKAAAEFLRKFGDAIESGGKNIIAALAQQTTDSATQARQVHELERANQRADKLTEESDRKDGEIAELENKKGEVERENRKLKTELESANTALSEANEKLRQAANEATRLNNAPNPLKGDVDRLQGRVNDLETENTKLKGEKDAAEKTLTDLKDELLAISSKPDTADKAADWARFHDKWLQAAKPRSGTAPEPATGNTKSDAADATPVQTTATPAASKSKPGPIKRFRESFKKEN